MKYTIIFGFFAIILVVSAMPSGNSGVQRVLLPRRWAEAAVQCLQNVPKAVARSFHSYNPNLASRAAKLLALCYYSESGQFVDGLFDPLGIENFLRKHIGPHNYLDRIVNLFKNAANIGNAASGDFSHKAYVYHSVLGIPENRNLIKVVFRPLIDALAEFM